MSPANLQLQGLLTALGELLKLTARKGALQRSDILAALEESERANEDSEHKQIGLSDAHLEAIRFPARFLREALAAERSTFDAIAREVGKTKDAGENSEGI